MKRLKKTPDKSKTFGRSQSKRVNEEIVVMYKRSIDVYKQTLNFV